VEDPSGKTSIGKNPQVVASFLEKVAKFLDLVTTSSLVLPSHKHGGTWQSDTILILFTLQKFIILSNSFPSALLFIKYAR